MVKRIVVGAHYGLRDWLVQRVTAIYMAIYLVLMSAVLLVAGGGYEAWRALLAHGLVQFASFLFIIALCWHAWIGVRDLWMDYVAATGGRLVLHVLTAAALIGYAGWAVQILWRS